MANKKISTMTPATTVDGTESLEVVQSGANKKMTVALLKSFEEAYSNLSGTTWDLSTGRKKTKTISADTAITLTNSVSGRSLGQLVITQSGGPFTLTINSISIPLNEDGPTWIAFSDYGAGIIFDSNAASGDPIEAATWADLLFPTAVGVTESPSKVFSGGNAAFGSYALSDSVLIGTGAIRCKTGSPGTNANALMGLKTTNVNGDYSAGTKYKFGFYVSDESGHLRVQHIDDGVATAVAGSVYGVGYINYGDYLAIFRNVATGVLTLKTSSDGVTWITSWTFAATDTNDLYVLINPYQFFSVYEPMILIGTL